MKRGTYEIELNGTKDYQKLHAAVRLRLEACEANDERLEAHRWKCLLRKIELIKRKVSTREKKS